MFVQQLECARMEKWKHVFGFKNLYAVSDRGRVFSFQKERLLVARLKPKDRRPSARYLQVEFNVDGVRTRHDVHKLVLTAFRGPRLTGQECRHLDGDRENNHLSNLIWGTWQENREDFFKHGKWAKLTPDLVRYIRQSPKTVRALAVELGCGKSTINYARNGRHWADVV